MRKGTDNSTDPMLIKDCTNPVNNNVYKGLRKCAYLVVITSCRPVNAFHLIDSNYPCDRVTVEWGLQTNDLLFPK